MSQLLVTIAIIALTFSKADFFKSLESGNKQDIATMETKVIQHKNTNEQQAFLGTLKMKASEFEKTPAEKLKKFKEGKILLEKSIQSEPTNPEFRFLRLMIQEHAPKILKYNDKISTDASFIKANFQKLSSEVQTIVKNYSKSSSNLQL